MLTCTACGRYELGTDDWFCHVCGAERDDCPSCGSEIQDGSCDSCGTTRQAPCEECDQLIPVDADECPNCHYNPSSSYKDKAEFHDTKSSEGSLLKWFLGGVAGVTIGLIITVSGGAAATVFGLLIVGMSIITTAIIGVLALLGIVGGKAASTVRNIQANRAMPASIDKGNNMYLSDEYISEWKNKKQRAHQRTRIQCPDCSWSTETIVYGNITSIETERESSGDSTIASVTSAAADVASDIASDKTIDCNVCDAKINIYTDWDGVPEQIKNKV